MTKPYRVLSIDGGGIRGLYSACLLQGISQRVARTNGTPDSNLDVGKAFDMIVGTSTGAILAVALAAGCSLEDVINLYKTKSKDIFPSPTPNDAGMRKMLLWLAKHTLKTSGSESELQKALKNVLADETVEEMYHRRNIGLCIPTINAETQKAWVYKTPHDNVNNRLQRDNKYALVDVCMSSASAPIVFPLHKVKNPNSSSEDNNWFVDGGLWANNPIMVALVEALSFAPDDSKIEIISVSTCPPFTASMMDDKEANRGLLHWKGGIGILEMGLDAQSSAYDYMAKTLTDKMNREIEYVRLSDPELEDSVAQHLTLDNPSDTTINALVKLANRAVDKNMSEATTGDKTKSIIMDIFSGLSQIKKQ